MKQSYKLSLIVFFCAIIVLGMFIWMPGMVGPDGLERSLFDITGDENYEPDPGFFYDGAPFPDYEFPGLNNGLFQNWLIGLLGSVFTLFIAFGFFKLILLKKSKKLS
jgi:hypothetical protein